MVVKVKNISEARKKLADFEKQVSQLERQLEEAEDEKKTLNSTIHTLSKTENYDDLVEEVKKLKQREQSLLEYNNEQVEERRKVAAKLRWHKAFNKIFDNPLFEEYLKLEKKYNDLKGIKDDEI